MQRYKKRKKDIDTELDKKKERQRYNRQKDMRLSSKELQRKRNIFHNLLNRVSNGIKILYSINKV